MPASRQVFPGWNKSKLNYTSCERNPRNSMDNDEEQIEEIPSRPLTDEEQYFYERSYKELVESIPRIEDVAKFLIGATATTSGLFLAAFKLARGDKTVTEAFWLAPFL